MKRDGRRSSCVFFVCVLAHITFNFSGIRPWFVDD